MSSPSTVILPESYKDFLQCDARRKAYSILNGQKIVPQDFDYAQARSFYKAAFALSIIQFDFYEFMNDLWQKTWGTNDALTNGLTEFTAGEYKGYLGPENIWNNGRCIERAFKRTPDIEEDRVLWLACLAIETQEELALQVYMGVYKGLENVTGQEFPSMTTNAQWYERRNGFFTNHAMCRFTTSDREIDIRALTSAANSIMP